MLFEMIDAFDEDEDTIHQRESFTGRGGQEALIDTTTQQGDGVSESWRRWFFCVFVSWDHLIVFAFLIILLM
jgi:hypothetical protein